MVDVAQPMPMRWPDVVQTSPRLPDGTPFPTLYYLTCPRAASAIGTLESSGLMREMEARLAEDPDLAAAYRRAHEPYVAERESLEPVAEIEGISAGGMPDAGEVPARAGRRTPSPPARASIRWATRRWPPWPRWWAPTGSCTRAGPS